MDADRGPELAVLLAAGRSDPAATLILELVPRWQQPGLACRGLRQEVDEVVLLERGADLIRSPGIGGVRDALTATRRAD